MPNTRVPLGTRVPGHSVAPGHVVPGGLGRRNSSLGTQAVAIGDRDRRAVTVIAWIPAHRGDPGNDSEGADYLAGVGRFSDKVQWDRPTHPLRRIDGRAPVRVDGVEHSSHVDPGSRTGNDWGGLMTPVAHGDRHSGLFIASGRVLPDQRGTYVLLPSLVPALPDM
eukprot:2677627-Rhodomonas_salina.3